ncbi:glycoside hydrolase family 73 protein [Peptoniphilus sp. KCTC 25270]|uniref:glycoside hydrolase family 73 protein n=1 Tax=Peptoniphilus sp. KCTC 25270 TaxID=2897414 RepID=UPI00272CA836|nr:glucosaminidase domain-containing protein [Peptoniphilus sp. KCTC 25270]
MKKATRRKKQKRQRGTIGFLLLSLVMVMGLFVLVMNFAIPSNPEFPINNREEFFQKMAPYAQKEGKKHGLYPSIILAQAALESNYGESVLSKEYNNYFGIKGTKENGVSLNTDEIYDGERVSVEDYFRVYDSVKESFQDYGNLIGKASRYSIVREAASPEEYAQNLYKAGYSTNPRYGDSLLHLVEQYNLKTYDEDL